MATPSLPSRLMMFAPIESLVSVLLLACGGYLIWGYLDFQSSPFAKDITPALYTFGMWPFLAIVVAGLAVGYKAFESAKG